MTMHAPRKTIPMLLAAMVLSILAWPLSSRAAPLTFLVGADGACDYATLQAAIDAAASHPGEDAIRVASNTSYTQQALTIGGQDLTITGGYASCTAALPIDALPTAGITVLDGAGGAAQPVLRISGGGVRDLRNLAVRNGDPSGDTCGGGIQFFGSGDLILRNISASNNRAACGGGIYFAGNGSPAILTLETSTVVLNNTARDSGGGIYLGGSARLFMLRDRTTVANNTAGDYGGGIVVVGPALADIASPGYANFGAIDGNSARRGGGLALLATADDTVRARMFSTTPGIPVRLHGNRASDAGGAIWNESWKDGLFNLRHATLCGFDMLIDGNSAPQGAAIDVNSTENAIGEAASSDVSINFGESGSTTCRGTVFPEPTEALGRIPCVTGPNSCNFIANNRAVTNTGVETGGAIIYLGKSGGVEMDRIVMIGNVGGNAIRGANSTNDVTLRTDLLVGNSLSGDTIQLNGSEPRLEVTDSTIANNVNGGATHQIRVDSSYRVLNLRNNILWQPGKLTLLYPGGGQNLPQDLVRYNIVSDASTLPQGPYNRQTDPRFIDPSVSNYGLRVNSPAIDFSLVVGGDDRGIDGRPRDQQVRPGPPGNEIRDAGALERQSDDPYLINGSFDNQLWQWPNGDAQFSRWVAINDGPANGSGSVELFIPANQIGEPGGIQFASVGGPKQCFETPWPGNYRLSATGNTRPDNTYLYPDRAVIHWALRYSSPQCTGPANAEGDLILPFNLGWNSPIAPMNIPIPASLWNFQTSLEIQLVAEQGPGDPAPQSQIFARIDNVRLDYVSADPLFMDGFENGDAP